MRFMALLSVGLNFGASALAATDMKNFYCGEYPQSFPSYAESTLKRCGNEIQKQEGICTEQVFCAYLTPQITKLIEEKFKTDISKVTEAQKMSYFQEQAKANPTKIDWHPTLLTCPGRIGDSGPVCPSPENCKNGDLAYNVVPAMVVYQDQLKLNQDQKNLENRVFQPGNKAE
jgi:hypothetical protein